MSIKTPTIRLAACVILLLIAFRPCAAGTGSNFIDSRTTLDSGLTYTGSAVWTEVLELKVVDQRLYCVLPNGVKVYDISNPASPIEISKLYAAGRVASRVDVVDNTMLIGFYRDGLSSFDISDPFNPVEVDNLGWTCSVHAISAEDSLAVVGCGNDVALFSVSPSGHLNELSVFDSPGQLQPYAIKLHSNTALVCAYEIHSVDISNPLSPSHIDELTTQFIATDAELVDTVLFVADQDLMWPASRSALTVVSVGDDDSLEFLTSKEFRGNALSIEAQGEYTFLSGGMSGLLIYDVLNPSEPVLTSCYFGQGRAGPVAIAGDYAYLGINIPFTTEEDPYNNCDPGQPILYADSLVPPGGIHIIDHSDKANPELVGRIPTGGRVQFVTAADDYAYAADENSTVHIIDLSNPKEINEIGLLVLPNACGRLKAADGYLFVPAGSAGLLIYDLTDPVNPIMVDSIDTPGGCGSVEVKWPYAYVCDSYWGLQILDISSIGSAFIAGSIDTYHLACDVAVKGDYAFVADCFGGLYVVDVSNKVDPEEVVNDNRYCTSVEIQGDFLYTIGDYDAVLATWDVSDPLNPVITGRSEISGDARDIAIRGDYLYAGMFDEGVAVFDISDSSIIPIVSSIETPCYAVSVTSDPEGILVASPCGVIRFRSSFFTSVDGAEEAETGLPGSFGLQQNYPNPFNSSTVIEFDLPHPGEVEIAVFDITGRRVATLVSGWHTAGQHKVKWNADGLASGVYVCRMSSAEFTDSRTMVLLK